MRRICCWCKKVYGERCQKCGSIRVKALNPENAPPAWECTKCKSVWLAGSQPDTHGICATCEPLVKAGVLTAA